MSTTPHIRAGLPPLPEPPEPCSRCRVRDAIDDGPGVAEGRLTLCDACVAEVAPEDRPPSHWTARTRHEKQPRRRPGEASPNR